MSLRSHLADELKKRLPRAWAVRPYRFSIDGIKAPVVMIAPSRLEKAQGRQGALLSLHEHLLTLTVFVPEVAPEKRYDAIEAAVDRVVVALEKLQTELSEHVRWDSVSYSEADDLQSADISIVIHAHHDYAGTPVVTS